MTEEADKIDASSKPTMKKLLHFVNKVASKWNFLGYALLDDNQSAKIQNIKSNYKDNEQCCIEMFNCWLTTHPEANWDDLVKALSAADLQTVATDLEKMFIEPTSSQVERSNSCGPASTASAMSQSNALEFSLKQKMHIAFRKLTEEFFKEFKKSYSEDLTDVIRWYQKYCSQCNMTVEFDYHSLNGLFKSINMLPYHNCLNPELLYHLAECSNIEYLIQSVRNYEETFSEFRLKDVTLDMGEQIQEIKIIKKDKNCSELVTKLHEKDLTVGQLRGLTAKLDEKILYLRAGVTLPQWIEEGCICIIWLIPSYLVKHAYNSACLNVKLFSEFNLLHLKVGRYMVEVKNKIVEEQLNPTRIFCNYYLYLMENLQPVQVSKMLYYKKLLSEHDLDAIVNLPVDHMKSFYIIEHFRLMGATGIFEFADVLLEIGSHKRIGNILRNELKLNGYTTTSEDVHLSSEASSIQMNYDETESKISLKIFSESDKMQQLLPDLDKSEKLNLSPKTLLMQYLDLCDSIIRLLQTLHPKQIIKKIENFVISEEQEVKLFSDSYIKSLNKITSTIVILRSLFLYSSWYDFSVVEELVKECDCSEGVDLLDWFNLHIDKTLPISHYPLPILSSLMIPHESSSHFLMAMRYREELFTLLHITKLKSFLLHTFEIKSYACILLSVASPDILYWLLPNNVFTIICKKVLKHIDDFYTEGITEVAISPDIVFTKSGEQNVQSLPQFTFEDKESQKYQPLSFDEFWADLQWQTVHCSLQDLEQLLHENNAIHFTSINSKGDTPLTYLLNKGVLMAIKLLKPFKVDASKVDLTQLIKSFGKILTQENLRDLIELGSKADETSAQLTISYATKMNRHDLVRILHNELLKDASTTVLPTKSEQIHSMQPKEIERDSLQNTVVQKVTKLVNMPPEYFMECIENEKKTKSGIIDIDEVDDDDDDDDDSTDYDEPDDDRSTNTSGYVSLACSSEISSMISLDNISITDTDSLFASDSEDNFDIVSTSDDIVEADDAVQDDGSGASDSIEPEVYTWEVECTKEFWRSLKKLAQPNLLRQQALKKIVRLAKGEWRHFTTVKTKGHGLQLFYINLTAKLRIIWQLAIAYSPKKSTEYRNESTFAKTDVIYSQIIRIWRIVTVDKMNKCIRLIQKCVSKEKLCDPVIGSKNLIILTEGFPQLYRLTDTASEDCMPVHFPANHKNAPLQLYKMDNALLYMYNHQGFIPALEQKLSPEENAIIDVDPNESIILLGRSGTGKTICCLHRLWKQFFDYWIKKIKDKEEVTESESHLRQAFITKSYVLCNRFKKRFYNLMSGRKDMRQHFQRFQNKSQQFKIQDFHPYDFPLFVTSRDWLLLLDVSLEGQRFFKYNKDGSLLTKIIESECAESNPKDIELFDSDLSTQFPTSEQSKKSWRKVDSDLFINEIWPTLTVNKTKVDPILVWLEIHSFIKGSLKALLTNDGWLTKEDYINFGAKMAPNFKHNREFIYSCFEEYQVIKKHKGYFDENDLIHKLYHRLKMKREEPLIHRLYVDEVQDFTQAELALLLLCSHIPYGQFLTGDTAQNIMRSVSFRFCDLRSIFYDFKANLDRKIKVPEVRTLTQNFRSHSGILQLAASVIDLLMNFFKSSLDKLPSDQGMFPGPKPVLISSCSYSDLAQLVRISGDESAIEFGASQAIIVRSEQARTKLPDELKVGIVLTVNEAKGLEFDDVLLYDFFADSEIDEQWRIVTSFTDKCTAISNTDFIAKPRPLTFHEEQHKMLNSELKLLYTAITRARSKLWIFDCSSVKRAPIFHYFVHRGLVEYLSNKTGKVKKPITPFSSKSSAKLWKKRGNYFKEKGMWNLAVICYNKAEAPLLSKDALGHYYAQLAKIETSKQRHHYSTAANYFCECLRLQQSAQYLEKIANCLYNAQKYKYAAELFEKMEDIKRAIVAYQKVGTTEALLKAVMLQKEHQLDIDGAISTCKMDRTGNLLPTALKMALNSDPPKSESFISDLALKTSSYYLKDNKPGYALRTAVFIVEDDRIRFYKSNGFVDEYINLLQETKRLTELYRYLKGCNKFEEGANIAKKFDDTSNHIVFVLLTIRSKLLQNIVHPTYSKIAQQNDAKELRSLLKRTHDRYLQEELLYYIALLEGRNNHMDLNGYFKLKAFDVYVNMFKNDLSNFSVTVLFENLGLLLVIHNSYLDESMVKFFDVLHIEEKYYICPLILLELHVSHNKAWKKDENGLIVMNKSQLQVLFQNHTKSFARNWLKVLDKILEYKEENHHIFSSYVKVQDIMDVIQNYTNAIVSRYYYDNFNISCPKTFKSDAFVILMNLLSFPWTCYIPIIHRSVEGLTRNYAIDYAFQLHPVHKTMNPKKFVEKWVFHGNTQQFINFSTFAKEHINLYFSAKLKMSNLSPVISKLEIITLGLLGNFSLIHSEHKVVIPQSYEIATGFFDSINDYTLFSLLADSEMKSTDILILFHKIIKILLGDTLFKSMLSMALCMDYPDDCPVQYQFERCFVLALTLLGNLAPYLTNDMNKLFQQSFKFLATLTAKFKSHQKGFIPLINKAINASTTIEVFMVIRTIQQLHLRGMVTFDFAKSCFKMIPTKKFSCFTLYSKPENKEVIVPTDAPDLELLPSSSKDVVQSTTVVPEKIPLTIPQQKQDKGVTLEHTLPKKSADHADSKVGPVTSVAIKEVSHKGVSYIPLPITVKKVAQPIATSTHDHENDDAEDPKSPITHDSEVKLSSKTTIHKDTGVPRELKLLPHFMLTKEQKALYGHLHIDKHELNQS